MNSLGPVHPNTDDVADLPLMEADMKRQAVIFLLTSLLAIFAIPAPSFASSVHWTCNDDGYIWVHITRDNGTTWTAQTNRTCGANIAVSNIEVVHVVFGEATQGPEAGLRFLRFLERGNEAIEFRLARGPDAATPEWVSRPAAPPLTVTLNPADVGDRMRALLAQADPQWDAFARSGPGGGADMAGGRPAIPCPGCSPSDPARSQAPTQCIAAPSGIAFWARFNGALGPDEIRGQTVRGQTSPARQLIDTDIPGHAGRFLRRGGANSQVWFDSPAGVTPSPHFLGLSDFSVEFWIRIDPVEMARSSYGTATILDTRTTRQQGSRGISVFAGNGSRSDVGFLRLMIAEDSSAGRYRTWGSDAVIADGRWHHVAISVDRDSATGGRMAVDGQIVNIVLIDPGTNRPYLLGSPQDSFDPTPVSGRLGQAHNVGIGLDRVRGAAETPFDIDEVAFYNRALTIDEMLMLARLPKCP